MKIGHYIIVNFLSWQSTGWNRKIEDPLLEQQRLATLEKYLLPSLEKQTNRDFTLIMYIGKQLSADAREYLAEVKTSFPMVVGEYRVLKREIDKAWEENDVVITSKMADDDMIYPGASAEVKRIAAQGVPFVIHGYRRGYVYVEGKGIAKWRYPNNSGHLAIFMSLIRKTDGPPITINHLGHHGDVRINAREKYKEFGLNKLPEGWWNSDDTTFPAWCYVRHPNAIFGRRDDGFILNPDLSPLKEYFSFEVSNE